jgi:hypothetical protein
MPTIFCSVHEPERQRGCGDKWTGSELGAGDLPLSSSPNFYYSSGSPEDTTREMLRRDGRSILARPLLVEFYQTYDPKLDGPRSFPNRFKKGPVNGQPSTSTSTGQYDNVSDLLKIITTPKHRFGMLLAMQTLSQAGMPFQQFAFWLVSMSNSVRRKRLVAWKEWYEFCEDTGVTVERMQKIPNLNFLITEFILHMTKNGVSQYKRCLAKSAAVFLLEMLRGVKDLGKDRLIKELVALTNTSYKAKPKYTNIWDLTILLDYIRTSPTIEALTNTQLAARVTALLMIFASARPIEVFRINPRGVLISHEGRQLSIPTHRKTDKGKITSILTIMALPDHRICPVRYFNEVVRRSKAFIRIPSRNASQTPGMFQLRENTLFRWDNNQLMKNSSNLCTVTKLLLTEANIPPEYKTYSIRHAAITKAFRITKSALKVNVFTGHSQKTDTSSRFYLHEIDNWLGFDLAKAAPEEQRFVNRVNQKGHMKEAKTKSEGEQSDSEKQSSDDDSSDSEVPHGAMRVRSSSRLSKNGIRKQRRHRTGSKERDDTK